MEVLEIVPGWNVELGTPECELKFEGCTGSSKYGIRVHRCALHLVCNMCAYNFSRRVTMGHRKFGEMRCKNCGRKFGAQGYYEVVKL